LKFAIAHELLARWLTLDKEKYFIIEGIVYKQFVHSLIHSFIHSFIHFGDNYLDICELGNRNI